MQPTKEKHPTANRFITNIDHHFGISLSKKQCDVFRILSKCNLCENPFVQFLYSVEEAKDYEIGDIIPGGQLYSG